MISWLSNEVDKLWNNANSEGLGLSGFVCETHDEDVRGHIVILFEIGDDFYYQLHLGDCTGLSDDEINSRFVERFKNLVKAYDDYDDCCFPILERLQSLSDSFLATIK